MLIDSHQHFWKYNEADYAWMSDSMDVLRRNFLPVDLEPKLERLGLGGSIAVQARQMLVETEWLLELADQHSFIQGVVGWVDFESKHLDEQLEKIASHPKLKGVRELIHDMPSVDYAVSSVHTSAVSKLAKLGLTYDLLLKPPHIRPAIELVRSFPNQPFVVDHLAKPAITAEMPLSWESDIKALATCDNVCCKLSGMVTEARWHQWKPADFRPYLEVTLEAFGPDRLMIGSDWPVCTLSGTYEDVLGIVIDFVSTMADDERAAILGGACARFYGIGNECKPAVRANLEGVQP